MKNYRNIKSKSDYIKYAKDIAKKITWIAIQRLIEDKKTINGKNIAEKIYDDSLEHNILGREDITTVANGHNIILKHTDNKNYGAENIGWDMIQTDNCEELKSNIAFWAFYGDVMHHLKNSNGGNK
tara:strand:+ start:2138 stop:2515 length:378 start_codon:yes stop_codon:yes gene_type:complete